VHAQRKQGELTVERFPSKTVVTRAVVRLGRDVDECASSLQSNYVRMLPFRLGGDSRGLASKFRAARVSREIGREKGFGGQFGGFLIIMKGYVYGRAREC
jgi:hypothetical protein